MGGVAPSVCVVVGLSSGRVCVWVDVRMVQGLERGVPSISEVTKQSLNSRKLYLANVSFVKAS